MSKIRIIHIDDDSETLASCKILFQKNSSIEYKAGFSNAKDAIDYLKDIKADLIFCDIEMPVHNGLWLANNLSTTIPIVFITAHSGFAVEAFEACALHYLIKPLSEEQLANVISRFENQELKNHYLKEQVAQFYNQYLPQDKQDFPRRIYINNIGKIIIIDLSDVLYMVGAGNYTKFTMANGDVHTSSKNLKVYDDAIIHHPDFIRIHRSYLVNKKYIKQILKSNKQLWFVEMQKNEKLELSKGMIDEILEQLQK